MAYTIHCPHCDTPNFVQYPVLDGSLGMCSHCGYQELVAGIDVQAQLRYLDDNDSRLAAQWRAIIGEQKETSCPAM